MDVPPVRQALQGAGRKRYGPSFGGRDVGQGARAKRGSLTRVSRMNIIKRALELARESRSLEEMRSRLVREGFEDVDDHLASPSLRRQMARSYRRPDGH